jgi:hypothetical protein
MPLPIDVDGYSGLKANERPLQFCLDEDVFEIEVVEDRWYDPEAEYFKVRRTDGKRHLLRYDRSEDAWTLRSGFDAAELFARPSIELITVDATAIREAEQRRAVNGAVPKQSFHLIGFWRCSIGEGRLSLFLLLPPDVRIVEVRFRRRRWLSLRVGSSLMSAFCHKQPRT